MFAISKAQYFVQENVSEYFERTLFLSVWENFLFTLCLYLASEKIVLTSESNL